MVGIARALGVIREHRRAYLVLNVVYYGLVACAMVLVAFHPEVQQSLLEKAQQGLTQGPLAAVASAYAEGRVLTAMALTFVVNLLLGAFVSITLPSLVIPFAGLFVGIVRAVLWGVLLSPASPQLRGGMIVHSLTLILEGQAYILAMLATYVQGKSFLRPHSVGAQGHLHGYWLGLKYSMRLYILVVIVLAVAAVYEALEVIYLVPLLTAG